MDAAEFLATRSVFTTEEFGAVLGLRRRSRDSLLTYYRRRGRILPIRRGLYWVVPLGSTPANCAIDPFLVAAYMADDAVLAYHTALEFHGRAYTAFNRFQYQTTHATREAFIRNWRFQPVRPPKTLLSRNRIFEGVQSHDRAGQPIRVTGLERTMVDVLDRPELAGGWEEVWRSLEMIEFFDLDEVVEYALLLGTAATVGKTGWFLQQHRQSLMVDESHLRALRENRPKQPYYLARTSAGAKCLIPEWNLIAPEALVERRWADVA